MILITTSTYFIIITKTNKVKFWTSDTTRRWNASHTSQKLKINEIDLFLRLDIFIELNDKDRFITINENATRKKNRMQLNEESFIKQRAIVCWDAIFFRNNNHANVLKLSWIFDKRLLEADHLWLTREKKVKDIANFIKYQRIINMNELRSKLIFSFLYQFRNDIASVFNSFFQTQLNEFFDSIQNFNISKISSKRKRFENEQDNQKKFRSNNQKFKLNQQYEATQKSNESIVNLYDFDNDKYNNRVFECSTIALTNWALSKFIQRSQFTKSISSFIKELFIILRNAIKAHCSLYLKRTFYIKTFRNTISFITNSNEINDFTK